MSRLFASLSVLLSLWICAAETPPTPAPAPAPQTLELKLDGERSKILAGSKIRLGALLGYRAPEAPAGAPPTAVQMVVVIDRSGSMSAGGKIEMVRMAGSDLVDRMDSADQLGLVAYDSTVDIVRPLAAFADPAGVKGLINQIHPNGNTNLGGGLQDGIGLFQQARENCVKRLLLMTDGLANQGEQDPAVLSTWAKTAFDTGTRISCIGLGTDYNAGLLKQIAHAGGGEFYYVQDRGQLPDLFQRELQDGRTMVVRDLSFTFQPQPGAKLEKVVGYKLSGDVAAPTLKIGDLAAKESRALLLYVELTAPQTPTAQPWVALQVDTRWLDHAKQPQQKTLTLQFDVTAVDGDVAKSINETVRLRILEDQNFQDLDKASELLQKNDRNAALELLKAAEARINSNPAALASPTLMSQAGQLAQARIEVEQGVSTDKFALANTEQSAYGQRGGGGWGGGNGVGTGAGKGNFGNANGKALVVKRAGGSKATESAADSALRWLANHQEANGNWIASKWEGADDDTLASSALAALTFLGAGHTEKVGEYKANVKRAVAWLTSAQSKDGLVGCATLPTDPLARYRALSQHALATVPLCEAAGMSGSPETRVAAQKAIDCLVAQDFFAAAKLVVDHADLRPDDSLGVGFVFMALKSAKVAGLTVPAKTFDDAILWLESRKKDGRFRLLRDKDDPCETAIAALCFNYVGFKSEETRPALEWVLPQKDAPLAFLGDELNHGFAYFGTLAYFNTGGDLWKTWNDHVRGGLAATQNKTGDTAGSWDPRGIHKTKGRVFSTSLSALCLEVYYRYTPSLK